MNVALLTTSPKCRFSLLTLKYFREKGCNISLILIETKQKTKFPETVIKYSKERRKYFQSIFGEKTTNYEILKKIWSKKIPHHVHILDDNLDNEAQKLNIPIVKVQKHSSLEAIESFKQYNIKYVLLLDSKWLIKEPLLSYKGTYLLNAHCGKLPKHRSLDSVPWSLLANDELGLTTHIIDKGVDTGPILKFIKIKPDIDDELFSLQEKIFMNKPVIFYESIIGLENKTIKPIKQKLKDGIHHTPMTFEELLKSKECIKNYL